MIRFIEPIEYKNLIKIWESAVVHTHNFLDPADFVFYKSMLPSYFAQVTLLGYELDGVLVGFMGTHQNSLEMLFIHQDCRGKGIGKKLLLHGIEEYQITTVEVNEQNHQAIQFYEHMGFQVIERKEKDGAGKDYPILKMNLSFK